MFWHSEFNLDFAPYYFYHPLFNPNIYKVLKIFDQITKFKMRLLKLMLNSNNDEFHEYWFRQENYTVPLYFILPYSNLTYVILAFYVSFQAFRRVNWCLTLQEFLTNLFLEQFFFPLYFNKGTNINAKFEHGKIFFAHLACKINHGMKSILALFMVLIFFYFFEICLFCFKCNLDCINMCDFLKLCTLFDNYICKG